MDFFSSALDASVTTRPGEITARQSEETAPTSNRYVSCCIFKVIEDPALDESQKKLTFF